MVKYESVILGIICGLVGIMGGIIIEATNKTFLDSNARSFQEQGLPKIIRTYNEHEADDLFVEDSNDPNNYISFKKHLQSIPNKYERSIEESKIKKLVKW
jgi:hypothetical protein